MKTLLVSFLAVFVFSNIELEKRNLLDNKIEILVPKEFKALPEDLLKIKYPGKNRPKLVLSDDPGTTNLGFSLLDAEADSSMIPQYAEKINASYKGRASKWIKDGLMTVNGKKVGYFKFISEGLDQKIYNFIFLTDVEGKLLIGTFNCVEKDLPTWQDTADKIVESLKTK